MLTAEMVQKVMESCMYRKDEIPDNGASPPDAVLVEGIVRNYGFHPERLKVHAEIIAMMLAELPEQFQEDSGGGWSFLNACNDKHGNQWTGLHVTMESLFCLGIGIGKAKWLMPKDTWHLFPGGVPYVVVLK